jgi:hypothetical protein
MKTPMQELLDKINNEEFDHLDDCKMFIQEYMLEKEKEVITDAWMDDRFPLDKEWVKQCAEQYYNETFNTKSNDTKRYYRT